MIQQRIGIGYDIHRLVEGRKLFLGGTEIPFSRGLLGHSDGDVILHALCDALLGAIAQGDIGEHFPDTDPRYEGVASIKFMQTIVGLVHKRGFTIHNVDIVVIAQEPKLSVYKKAIQQNIARMLALECDAVGIKAKTNESLGPVGHNEAIACYAVALLSREGSV